MKKYFTSESVTEGHPDKVADIISDSLLDEFLKQDKDSRVAIETLVSKGLIVISGEVTTKGYVDIQRVVRQTLREIGYSAESGFDPESVGILININSQSADIALGVDERHDREQGAGDQGIMFGYATDETKELLPLPIVLANKLAKRLTEVRKRKIIDYLFPDGKTQVTIEYDDENIVDGRCARKVDTIVISSHHKKGVSQDRIKKDIKEKVIDFVFEEYDGLLHDKTKILINPTGAFEIGGPSADTGLTGRKIIVDTYGGWARHGGGAFSGKDASKVDRSGAYMARFLAREIVKRGYARECEVQLAYAIGVAEPVGIYVDRFDTESYASLDYVSDQFVIDFIKENYSLKPKDIIDRFHLKEPIFKQTASYGHFQQNEKGFYWEK